MCAKAPLRRRLPQRFSVCFAKLAAVLRMWVLLPSALRSYCHDGMRNSLLTVVCYADVLTIVRASRTGERLLNPRVQAGFTKVMRHVREGCVSDPDPRQLAMHVVTGRSEDGLLTFRSMRGTTNVENYHKQFKDVVLAPVLLCGWRIRSCWLSTRPGTTGWQVRLSHRSCTRSIVAAVSIAVLHMGYTCNTPENFS